MVQSLTTASIRGDEDELRKPRIRDLGLDRRLHFSSFSTVLICRVRADSC